MGWIKVETAETKKRHILTLEWATVYTYKVNYTHLQNLKV